MTSPSYRRAWKLVRNGKHGSACIYCREPFTSDVPPTIDHVIPRSAGRSITHPIVLACERCNNSRGSCPYVTYANEVDRAHARAEDGGTPYRRPKWSRQRGAFV